MFARRSFLGGRLGVSIFRTTARPIPSISLMSRIGVSHVSTEHVKSDIRVAVLYQAIDPPVINGIRKPAKPGGYRDSGADIAFNLRSQAGFTVLTPTASPDPIKDADWSFPDTESGILTALKSGATHLWANTILFSSHPLQSSSAIREYQDVVNVIGQPPTLVEQFDDKQYVNDLLRRTGNFTLPNAWIIDEVADWEHSVHNLDLPYPVVGKPIRGRGSHGVKLCHTDWELIEHIRSLFKESPSVMVEEYLAGEEATVTVMPPSDANPEYWSMPIVTRFNHSDGIAPYNGVVAVSRNSRAITRQEYEADIHYEEISRECRDVAKLLRLTAPSRIDVRRFKEGSRFALFDVNMKPNMTGPGRPGREDQQSLTAIAAAALGWDYPRLLREMLLSSFSLRYLIHVTPDIA